MYGVGNGVQLRAQGKRNVGVSLEGFVVRIVKIAGINDIPRRFQLSYSVAQFFAFTSDHEKIVVESFDGFDLLLQ